MANLILRRLHQWPDIRQSYEIHLDGTPVASIGSGKTVEIEVAPGLHEITATMGPFLSSQPGVAIANGLKPTLDCGQLFSGARSASNGEASALTVAGPTSVRPSSPGGTLSYAPCRVRPISRRLQGRLGLGHAEPGLKADVVPRCQFRSRFPRRLPVTSLQRSLAMEGLPPQGRSGPRIPES